MYKLKLKLRKHPMQSLYSYKVLPYLVILLLHYMCAPADDIGLSMHTVCHENSLFLARRVQHHLLHSGNINNV